MKLLNISAVAISLITLIACTKDVGPNPDLVVKPTGCDTITFTKHIKPIITNYCAKSGCHVTGAQSPDFSNDLTLQSQAQAGRIKARLIDQNDMPPAGNPSPTNDEITSIKCWLEAGAPLN